MIKDFYLNESETGPEFSTLFSLHMLLSTAGGRCYRISEIKEYLRLAGFRPGRLTRMKENSRLIEARKTAV